MKFKNLVALYHLSPHWLVELSSSSRRVYTQNLRYLNEFFEMEVDDITRPMIIDLKDRLYHKSATCRLVMASLNNVLAFGHDKGLCKYNHAGSMRFMPKTKPIPRWSDDQIEKFLDGASPHLMRALMMALYTGQRCSDLSRMRWDQYDGSYITVLQQKTLKKGKALKIPVHPALKEVIDDIKLEQQVIRLSKRKTIASPYILLNKYDQPWANATLSASIRRRCTSLGFDRSVHGLRKTTAAKLAEVGCSVHMIAAITGHSSLREIARYTEEADQVRMADQAIGKWMQGAAVG
jgi:integrase